MTTVNSNLLYALKLAGLNQSEAEIYLICLELGPASAWNIFLKSGIKRPTCYAILENLVADGIASKTSDGQRTIFSVIKPEELLVTIDNKRNQFEESLPLFKAIESRSVEKPQIRVFEGIEGVRQAYMLGLNQPEKSEILIFGAIQIWQSNQEANKAYISERVNKKITLKVLFADNKKNRSMLKNDKDELRKTRFLSKKFYDPEVETQIFGDTLVYIAHSEKSPFATVIDNRAIANDERQRFLSLWSIAK